jgi:hypothetical protein
VGEGGLGDGFMACATVKGMVGMLLEETTGSKLTMSEMTRSYAAIRTVKVSGDSRLDECFHPLSNNQLFLVTEEVGLVRLVYHPETIAAWINIFVCHNLVADDIQISLDLGFLSTKILSDFLAHIPCSRSTNRFIVTFEPIKMWSFENKIS